MTVNNHATSTEKVNVSYNDKRLCGMVSGPLKKLVKELRAHFGDELVSVVLFGSFARGDFDQRSDIDLLIVFEELPSSFFERSRLFDMAERRVEADFRPMKEMGYLCQFMPVLKTRQEAFYHSPLYLDIVEDGKILYDKSEFIKGVLNDIRLKLSELGAQRKYLEGGGWYWDLKPDYQYGEIIEI